MVPPRQWHFNALCDAVSRARTWLDTGAGTSKLHYFNGRPLKVGGRAPAGRLCVLNAEDHISPYFAERGSSDRMTYAAPACMRLTRPSFSPNPMSRARLRVQVHQFPCGSPNPIMRARLRVVLW